MVTPLLFLAAPIAAFFLSFTSHFSAVGPRYAVKVDYSGAQKGLTAKVIPPESEPLLLSLPGHCRFRHYGGAGASSWLAPELPIGLPPQATTAGYPVAALRRGRCHRWPLLVIQLAMFWPGQRLAPWAATAGARDHLCLYVT